jgi:hypothetical protein
MAPGVGKTYRMLLEGRSALRDGTDVMVGLLETHGRVETISASEGLELYFHSLRFQLLIVRVTGRNLMPIHEMLKQHRVTYIKENPSEVDDLGEEQIYIEGVAVEEVE